MTLQQLIRVLEQYVAESGHPVELILIGGLALHAYAVTDRATRDVDAELRGDLDSLVAFLQGKGIPADLGENISGWSVIAMPPGYQHRTSVFLEQPGVRIRLLAPLDFVIAKLRRGTEQDLEDSLLVAQHFGITQQAIQGAAEQAIAASPKDTTLFVFRKTVEVFCREKLLKPN